jgi:hypothetical protein
MLGSICTHWRTLCIVFGSLLASILFAIWHHLFCQHPADSPASTANELGIGLWAGMPSQKFNVANGNTFASLFRMSVSIAVKTAYAQMVRRVLTAESTELDVVDGLIGILTNPPGFPGFCPLRDQCGKLFFLYRRTVKQQYCARCIRDCDLLSGYSLPS